MEETPLEPVLKPAECRFAASFFAVTALMFFAGHHPLAHEMRDEPPVKAAAWPQYGLCARPALPGGRCFPSYGFSVDQSCFTV